MTRNVRWVAERAGIFFEKANDTKRPFHLTIGFTDPHRDGTRGGFANNDQEVIDAGLDKEVPDYSSEEVAVQDFMTDCPELRQELMEYYKSISRMDLGVGLVLQALRDRDLEDSTLVVFVSDNGAPFINSKTTLYDAGVQLPLIVRQPAQARGVINPNMVSFLDILPTALAWAGHAGLRGSYPCPPRLGDSIIPILQSSALLPEGQWKHEVYGSHTFHEIQNYWPTRFIRSHRYKYHRNIAHRLDFPFAADLYSSLSWEGIRNKDGPEPVFIGQRSLEAYLFRGPEELYDLQGDPHEVENVADDGKYADVIRQLRASLERWQYETKDAWLFKDGVSAVVMETYVKQGLKLPDRWEMDPRRPGNRDVKHWQPPVSSDGGSEGEEDINAGKPKGWLTKLWAK